MFVEKQAQLSQQLPRHTSVGVHRGTHDWNWRFPHHDSCGQSATEVHRKTWSSRHWGTPFPSQGWLCARSPCNPPSQVPCQSSLWMQIIRSMTGEFSAFRGVAARLGAAARLVAAVRLGAAADLGDGKLFALGAGMVLGARGRFAAGFGTGVAATSWGSELVFRFLVLEIAGSGGVSGDLDTFAFALLFAAVGFLGRLGAFWEGRDSSISSPYHPHSSPHSSHSSHSSHASHASHASSSGSSSTSCFLPLLFFPDLVLEGLALALDLGDFPFPRPRPHPLPRLLGGGRLIASWSRRVTTWAGASEMNRKQVGTGHSRLW